MIGTLIVTAFGELSLTEQRLGTGAEEDLYSVFLARSELMGWSRLGSSDSPPMRLLWGMNEAELTSADHAQIGFVQVGLDVNPAVAILPMVQCVDDSLRWYGESVVSAYEVTVVDIVPGRRSYPFDLLFTLNWFGSAATTPARAVMTLATAEGDLHIAPQILNGLRQFPVAPFEFGPLVNFPANGASRFQWNPIHWATYDPGMAVSMPEWAPDSIGWVVARTFDVALSLDRPPAHLSVRVTRTQGG